MAREIFEQKLQTLQDDVLILGSMVENALTDSVDILKKRDMIRANRLIAADSEINRKRFAIEESTLTFIATQQPMAGDLRIVASILEIIGELERIGDYAKGIAKISVRIGEGGLIKPLVDIPVMAQKAREMLHESLKAFVTQDLELAKDIPGRDDEVDELYNRVYTDLIEIVIQHPNDKRVFDQITYLLWVAHNLERSADRVTNICERVMFTITGELVELDGGELVAV
ncbi:MAG: phosphate signaling complex protein PhoU [Chloroflexota bacterium]